MVRAGEGCPNHLDSPYLSQNTKNLIWTLHSTRLLGQTLRVLKSVDISAEQARSIGDLAKDLIREISTIIVPQPVKDELAYFSSVLQSRVPTEGEPNRDVDQLTQKEATELKLKLYSDQTFLKELSPVIANEKDFGLAIKIAGDVIQMVANGVEQPEGKITNPAMLEVFNSVKDEIQESLLSFYKDNLGMN